MRAFLCLILFLACAVPAAAQQANAPDRAASGGTQTLEDILARQREAARGGALLRPPPGAPLVAVPGAASSAPPLSVRGSVSVSDIWRALRHNQADVAVSAGGEPARVLVQDTGMTWLQIRKGPLRSYGGWLLLGTIAALALFYLLRGRIRLDEPPTGHTVTRFQPVERFAHWLLAGSFIVLALSGLLVLYGRAYLLPWLGKEMHSALLTASKWTHNNIAWAFILGLVMVFVLWVKDNLPDRTDLVWIRQFGGIIGRKHPPARKFNAGQKLVFWSVILLGGSISLSGLSLLFPFQLPLFAKTFATLNDLGLPGLIGLEPLPETLAPHQEMQLAQLWHAIVSFVLMAIIIAHIYIGTIGMEGAFDAMGTGEVDEAWAHQHHALWLEEVRQAKAASVPEPDAAGATRAE